jgi:hypothetical protein
MDWPKAYAVMRRLPLRNDGSGEIMKALATMMARSLAGR